MTIFSDRVQLPSSQQALSSRHESDIAAIPNLQRGNKQLLRDQARAVVNVVRTRDTHIRPKTEYTVGLVLLASAFVLIGLGVTMALGGATGMGGLIASVGAVVGFVGGLINKQTYDKNKDLDKTNAVYDSAVIGGMEEPILRHQGEDRYERVEEDVEMVPVKRRSEEKKSVYIPPVGRRKPSLAKAEESKKASAPDPELLEW